MISLRRPVISAVVAGAVALFAASETGDLPLPPASVPVATAPAPEPESEAIPDDSPPLHLNSRSRVVTEGGANLRLPRGYFVPEGKWDALDLEVKRLQDQETRLSAENEALRDSGGGPGWGTVAVVVGALALGAGGGYWLSER